MGKRLNIGLDIDGVIGNFTDSARKLLKEMYGKPDDSAVQTTWSFSSLGISSDEERAFWQKLDTIPNWWLQLKPIPGTSRLWDICNRHRVVFITNRKDGSGWPIEVQSQEWLCENFHLFRPNVLISDNKGPLMDALKLDYYIDDRPKNVEETCLASRHCQVALYDTTYNQEYKYGWRVRSLDDFFNQIDPIKQGDSPYQVIDSAFDATLEPRCIQ